MKGEVGRPAFYELDELNHWLMLLKWLVVSHPKHLQMRYAFLEKIDLGINY